MTICRDQAAARVVASPLIALRGVAVAAACAPRGAGGARLRRQRGRQTRTAQTRRASRGASDREAIRTATATLEAGWATGVFLDGTRQANGRVNAPLPGAALLAARSGAPLLPVAILNSHRALGSRQFWPRLVPIQLRIGTPIPPPVSRRRADLDATTALLQERINALLDQGLQHP